MGDRQAGRKILEDPITNGDGFPEVRYDCILKGSLTIMEKMFSTLIRTLVDGTQKKPPLAGFDVGDQFIPDQGRDTDVARNINAAFLILLSGCYHPLYGVAERYLDAFEAEEEWQNVVRFMKNGAALINGEIRNLCHEDDDFKNALEKAGHFCGQQDTSRGGESLKRIWEVLFPEGADCLLDQPEKILSLRANRHVHITAPNASPIDNPSRQMLFLSNLLVTTPGDSDSLESLPYESGMVEKLRQVMGEKQRYWFDHPIQIGVPNDNNEAIYGLRGLDNAISFEKERGVAQPADQLTCLLSVSVTHDGLHGIVKDYLREVYDSTEPFSHLNVYLFSENDTDQITTEILLPAMEKYMGFSKGDLLRRVFGVDGEYGRHYSFLKAMSALWQVLIDPAVKGSFKLDLDQVFDQPALVKETGHSALEHFKTPLWGAEGKDAEGNSVELGLMAGALVNAEDISRGLFTPDVPIPDPIPQGEALAFYSPLPMGISTRAEMMAHYDTDSLDGVHRCIQRVHVTGGTTAALIESIRRYRPFTPTFIGRAEDQAYLIGSLFTKPDRNLRYLHKPGLIMRHDKAVFAGEAIEGAKLGKYIGDLVRILLFSYYVRALPWPSDEIKKVIDPFTGCFASKLPFTAVYLRLSFHLAEMFAYDDEPLNVVGLQLLKQAVERLEKVIGELNRTPNPLIGKYRQEKEGWDLFYDLLDHLEEALAKGDAFALNLRNRARKLVENCRV
ncbi:MAG: hypothetical protein JRD04_08945 [Deltaproteobacteria bacterium]|nr:hypothetical protein [Deltaproteobacteria bacterium]